jgi:hypothetical protein
MPKTSTYDTDLKWRLGFYSLNAAIPNCFDLGQHSSLLSTLRQLNYNAGNILKHKTN